MSVVKFKKMPRRYNLKPPPSPHFHLAAGNQRDSELTKWYQQRFGSGVKRLRRIGIVALASKLLVALWKYVEFDEIPAGATVAK